ncbi:MAG: hypothetical protein GX455_05940 [Phycisphaerae bacterium]|nr:hypothetical protein [Phycisphaerae bacterium]
MLIDKWMARWVITACVGIVSWAGAALDTTPISGVFQKTGNGKTAPAGADTEVVTQFITAATEQILWAEKGGDAIDARIQLMAFRGQDQYAQAYVGILRGRLETVIKEAGAFPDAAKKAGALRNFSILIAQMDTLELAKLSVGLLGEKDTVIRYWAVKALTSEKISSQLSTAAATDASFRKQILDALTRTASQEDQPVILVQLARYALKTKGAEGRDLILTVVDNRMKSYVAWKVTQESTDLEILTVLVEKLAASVAPEDKTVFAGRFAQYYSYVIQRYAKGQDIMSLSARQALISTIVGTEESLLSGPALLNRKATDLRSAIQKNNLEALIKAHDAILGSTAGAGELAGKIKFTYEGNASAPKVLPPPPATLPKIQELPPADSDETTEEEELAETPDSAVESPDNPQPPMPPQPKPVPQPKPKPAGTEPAPK